MGRWKRKDVGRKEDESGQREMSDGRPDQQGLLVTVKTLGLTVREKVVHREILSQVMSSDLGCQRGIL